MLSPEGVLGVFRMVEIVDELKVKLVEIDAQLELLRHQIGALADQRDVFENVIKVYDPDFKMATAAPKRPRSTARGTASSRVTELLKGMNNRHVVLDILRDAGCRPHWMDCRSRVSSNMPEPSMAVATSGRSAASPAAHPATRPGQRCSLQLPAGSRRGSATSALR